MVNSAFGRAVWTSWGDRPVQIALWIAFAIYAMVVVKTAWLMDDAYITFRTVGNFIDGHGLTWNPSERVQAYTNPLWMFAVSALYFVTHEVFYTSLMFSVAVSVAAVWVLIRRISAAADSALIGVLLLINSKAFVDYSTSGLENPLSHLIVAGFAAIYVGARTGERKLLLLSAVAALGMVNRMDTVLLFVPALVFAAWSIDRRRAVAAVIIGFTPFVIWELFSLLYYGFLFPNTAYAKLNTGIPVPELAIQGLYYLMDSAAVDPLTLLTIATALALPWVKRARKLSPLAIGILLYLFYIVYIGGDFMSGRFLSAPMFAAVILLVIAHPFRGFVKSVVTAAAILLVGLTSSFPPLLSGIEYGADGMTGKRGVADERAAYYQGSSLLKAWAAEPGIEFPDNEWSNGARQTRPGPNQYGAIVWANIGFTGYFVGPSMHVIDPLALSDPLLARLPPVANPEWQIGHYRRIVPEGYFETQLHGVNHLVDRNLAAYYDKLCIVTRGDLLDPERWQTIWGMIRGRFDHLIDVERYRNPSTLDRYISDAYEEPRNVAKQFQLAEEYFRRDYSAKGMKALTTAIGLKRTILLERMNERGFPRIEWGSYLRRHLREIAVPDTGASMAQNVVFAHYTWIYATLRSARERSAQDEVAMADQIRAEAITHCREALSVQPDASILYLLGVGLQRNGEHNAAIAAFKQSLDIDRDDGSLRQTYLALANSLQRAGHATDAALARHAAAGLTEVAAE